MAYSCRENNAIQLEELLSSGETTIQLAATVMNRSVRYVHSLVKEWPQRFSCIGVVGPVGSWCIALAGNRPIYLVFDEAGQPKENV